MGFSEIKKLLNALLFAVSLAKQGLQRLYKYIFMGI